MIQVRGEKVKVVRKDVDEGLSHKYLKKHLHYSPETGVFTRIAGYKVKPGQLAGTISKSGYVKVKLCDYTYCAHRLAWFYVHGSWPKEEIDHINNNPSDNRLSNLREATASQNKVNRRRPKSNTSGFKCVSYYASEKRWIARFISNGKDIYVGRFPTKQEAIDAYQKASESHNGEFNNVRGMNDIC